MKLFSLLNYSEKTLKYLKVADAVNENAISKFGNNRAKDTIPQKSFILRENSWMSVTSAYSGHQALQFFGLFTIFLQLFSFGLLRKWFLEYASSELFTVCACAIVTVVCIYAGYRFHLEFLSFYPANITQDYKGEKINLWFAICKNFFYNYHDSSDYVL